MWARIHLIPILQAEEDRDLVRRYYADKAREMELLGREIKVYNSDRWVHICICSAVKGFASLAGAHFPIDVYSMLHVFSQPSRNTL